MTLPKQDDALIFHQNVPNAGTHVLIIGMSAYPHLLGGEFENPAIAEGMGQLDAPAISARAMAKWFLEEFENTEKPLASVSLVLSEPTQATFTHPKLTEPADKLPRGTAVEIIEAIQNWAERASQNRENLTIFFFCGHGVSAGESILLLRDFGAKPLSKFDGALNLSDFIGAMQTMMPEYQLFLVDSCRVPTSIARSVLGKAHVGRSGLDPLDLDNRGGTPAKQSVHHSSSALEQSWGRVQGASLYTEALLQALDGGGAQSNLGYWIGTLGLQTALAAYTPRLAAKERVEQQPELLRNVQFKIHRPKKIVVPLYVTSAPKEALSLARVEACLGANISGYFDPDEHKATEEWVVHLPMREHTISAKFRPPAEYLDEPPSQVMIVPPETLYPFQFRRK
jgi:hypothetical protein